MVLPIIKIVFDVITRQPNIDVAWLINYFLIYYIVMLPLSVAAALPDASVYETHPLTSNTVVVAAAQ